MIEIDAAGVDSASLTLLHPISFAVPRGAALVLRGANGAGKTTALALVAGLIPPTVGSVRVAGVTPDRRAADFRRAVASMLGLPAFARDLTLLEHCTLVATTWGLRPGEAEEAARESLSELGLDGLTDRFPDELSSGQTQLAGLALTLVRPAEVLVLDEPEQRLDQERLGIVLETLRRRKADGVTIVLASHSERAAAELAAESFTVTRPA